MSERYRRRPKKIRTGVRRTNTAFDRLRPFFFPRRFVIKSLGRLIRGSVLYNFTPACRVAYYYYTPCVPPLYYGYYYYRALCSVK